MGNDLGKAESECPGWDRNDKNKLNAALTVANMKVGETTLYSPRIKAGAFDMTNYKKDFAPDTKVSLTALKLGTSSFAVDTEEYATTNIFTTKECSVPMYGCVRISYYINDKTSVAAITQSDSNGVASPHPTESSWGCSAGTWHRVRPTTSKEIGKDEFTDEASSSNSMTVWLMRVVGLLLAWLAMFCVLCPIVAMADIFGDCLSCIPCIGDCLENIVETMVSCVVCFISCSTGCAIGLFVIAVVWIVMRPLYGLLLMLACCCLCGLAVFVTQQFQKHKGDSSEDEEDPEE